MKTFSAGFKKVIFVVQLVMFFTSMFIYIFIMRDIRLFLELSIFNGIACAFIIILSIIGLIKILSWDISDDYVSDTFIFLTL